MPPGRGDAGRRPLLRPSLTVSSLFALALGLALGVLGHARGGPAFATFARIVGPIGDFWLAALQMAALPLALLILLAAVVGARRLNSVGALAGRAMLLFVAMLVAAALVAVAATPLALRLRDSGSLAIRASADAGALPEAAPGAAAAARSDAGSGAGGGSLLLPRNVFEAAVRGDLLPLLLFTALFGIAVARLPDAQREPLTALFQGLAAAMLQCVRWILVLIPFGVFIFSFRFALGEGSGAVGVLGGYVAIISGVMLACTALLYPLTAVLGRTPVREFALGAAPAQWVAVTTRSSIAALPALIEGARDRMRLPDAATGLVLPLSVSVFKLDVAAGNVVKLFFLAHVYGVALRPAAVAAFLASILVLSFSSPGLPSAGSVRTLPAYLAVGIPIEGVVLVQAVESVPDVFMTLLNVTGDLSAATLLSRRGRAAAVGAPEPRPDRSAVTTGP